MIDRNAIRDRMGALTGAVMEPGRAYRFDIEAQPASYVFKQGHRIRLELANGDSSVTDGNLAHQYLWFTMGNDTTYHDAEHASRIVLPVIPRGEARAGSIGS